MPTRHIPPQAFDAILSDLGDDPAIPDPHGIRKSAGIPPLPKSPSTQIKTLNLDLSKTSTILGVVVLVLIIGLGLFWSLNLREIGQELPLTELQTQVHHLKKELQLMREELVTTEEEIYEEMDILKVSIHSLRNKTIKPHGSNSPKTTSGETTIKEWRYLGLSKAGGEEHAFFETNNGTLMLTQGDIAAGEWRLIQIQKTGVNFAHPNGKLIFLETVGGK
jgi:hypothetical protein